MSHKRVREHEDQDDISKLDPAVQAVIEGYESHLAQFMESLPSLLERYNKLLNDALPHNPKAVFYYQQPDAATDDANATPAKAETAAATDATATAGGDDATATKDASATTAAVAATPTTASSSVGTFPAVTPGSASDSTLRRAPTSPLLRRPQLPPQQLEELKLEAKAELERRTSNFAFPTSAELAAAGHHQHHNTSRSPDLKHKKVPSRDPSVAATAAAAATDNNTTTTTSAAAATEQPTTAATNPTATTTTTAPIAGHPLGIRTTLNKVLDKKVAKELVKKVAEVLKKEAEEETDNANAAAAAAEGEAAAEGTAEKKEEEKATTAATTSDGKEAAPTAAAADETDNVLEALSKTAELCTRTVAEVLKDIEIPPMLLAQLRILKKESQALMFTLDQIHDWIAMKAPAMNDSDNQGVAIMASVISVISSIMSSLQDLYDMEREYITKRGSLECQYVPNFECATIRDLIEASDNNKWDDIEVGWRTMMRAVIIVHSRLASNMKTLRTPRQKRAHNFSM